MHGKRVRTKDNVEVGIVESIIGDVAVVKYANSKAKVLVNDLIEAELTFTEDDLNEAVDILLDNKSMQSLFNDAIGKDETVYVGQLFNMFVDALKTVLVELDESRTL